MRTFLNEIETIEKHLLGTQSPEDSQIFAERLNKEPVLRLNVSLQKKVLSLVQVYHRKKMKEEAESVLWRLLSDPVHSEFKTSIQTIFND